MCVRSIRKQVTKIKYEVIIVDNGSKDRTFDIAKTLGDQYFRCQKKGPSAARNYGLKFSKGLWVAFVDSDVILEPDWLEKMMHEMTGAFRAGQGPIIPVGSNEKDFLLRYRIWKKNKDTVQTMNSLLARRKAIALLNTAACIYKKSDVIRAGLFDESFLRIEDFDLSLRVFYQGVNFIGVPEAKAYVYYTGNIWSYFQRSFMVGSYCAKFDKKYSLGFSPFRQQELIPFSHFFFFDDLNLFTVE
jgi:glycosyltransferase involved in cell wall biosynthesis